MKIRHKTEKSMPGVCVCVCVGETPPPIHVWDSSQFTLFSLRLTNLPFYKFKDMEGNCEIPQTLRAKYFSPYIYIYLLHSELEPFNMSANRPT